MRHNVDGRKFGRNTSHRTAMFRNMANSVIRQEQIVTTVQKAKEARRVVDRLITLGKSGTPANRRMAFDRTRDDLVVTKLFGELAKRYAKRAGGYTRVMKLSERRYGDAAEVAVLELVDHPALNRKRQPKAAATGEGAAADQSQASPEPFKRFKKMFSPKTKGGAGAAKAAKPARSAARKTSARKAPSGSSKSGSSS